MKPDFVEEFIGQLFNLVENGVVLLENLDRCHPDYLKVRVAVYELNSIISDLSVSSPILNENQR